MQETDGMGDPGLGLDTKGAVKRQQGRRCREEAKSGSMVNTIWQQHNTRVRST